MLGKRSNTLFSFSLSFAVRIGVVLTLLVGGFTAAFWFMPESYRAPIVFFGAAVAAAGQLAAAFYAGRTLALAVDVEERRLATENRVEKAQKEVLTYDYAARWTDASMFHLRRDFTAVLERGMREKNTIAAYIDEDQSRKANVGNMLNFLEGLALSVNTGRCDEEVAKRIFCGIVINIWNVTHEWASNQRASRGRPQLWTELAELHRRWST